MWFAGRRTVGLNADDVDLDGEVPLLQVFGKGAERAGSSRRRSSPRTVTVDERGWPQYSINSPQWISAEKG